MDAIRTVMSGKRYLSDSVAAMLGEASGSPEISMSGNPESRSQREQDIFWLIGRGESRSNIARILNISTKTVETHRANIKYKLNLSSAAELKECARQWLAASADGQ